MPDGDPSGPGRLDFAQRPILVFWETTRACLLSCRHCCASAISRPLPGELSPAEGQALLRQVAAFGSPPPGLVLTGGDCLMRPDLLDLAASGRSLGLRVCLSPSVTPRLARGRLARFRSLGVRVISISLDGARACTHDAVRGVPGHFDRTLEALRWLIEDGFSVQVNTTVMRDNVEELADVAALLVALGVPTWEVFFLVQVGRGERVAQLTPAENEDVCHFLVDASRHGVLVRTVEAPFFRRVVQARRALEDGASPRERFGLGELYRRLQQRLTGLLGPPVRRPAAPSVATRDGMGVVFVAHDGAVFPSGFLPVPLGNVRTEALAEVYRQSPLLQAIRHGRFGGRCGGCEFRTLCGGSRARAFAATGDPLGEDPGCLYGVTAAA